MFGRRSGLVCVALLAGLGLAAQARAQDAALTPWRAPGALRVEAEALALRGDGWSARGSVRLTTASGARLRAEAAALQGDTLTLTGVIWEWSGGEVRAASAQVSLGSGEVRGEGLRAPLEGGDAWVEAARFAWAGGQWRLEEATLALGEGGPRLTAAAASLRGGRWRAEGWAAVALGGAPVWWEPGVEAGADGRRGGLTPPMVGWLGGEGAVAGLGGFVPLGAGADLAPWAWWRGSGAVGGGARLRGLGEDGARAVLRVEGLGVEGRALGVEGSGSWSPGWGPGLRWGGRWLSSAEAAGALRLGLLERLGATTRGAALAGVAGEGVWVDAGVVGWQPLGLAGPQWGRGGVAEWAPVASGGFVGSPGGGVELSLEADLEGWEASEGAEGSRRLRWEGRMGRALGLGRAGRVRAEGRFGAQADVYEVRGEDQGALASRQRARGELTLGWEGQIEGRLGRWRHGLRPELGLWWAWARRGSGEEASSLREGGVRRGPWAAQGRLGQRLGGLRVELGGLWLGEVGGAEGVIGRLGAGLGWEGLGASAQVDARRGRVTEGLAWWSWPWSWGSVRLGGAWRAGGWRALARAERSLAGGDWPGVAWGGEGPLAGASGAVDAALWPGSGLSWRVAGLAPLGGEGEGRWELEGGLYLGGPGSAWRVGLEGARRGAPEAQDLLWTLRWGGF